MTRMPPRHHMMVKISMLLLMMREIMIRMSPRHHMMLKIQILILIIREIILRLPHDPPTNDVNINADSDDKTIIMKLPLIHLQMAKVIKKLTMMMKK